MKKLLTNKRIFILGCFAILIIIFILTTYLATPLFMVKPLFDEDAYYTIEAEGWADHVIIPGAGLSGWLIDSPETDDLIIYYGGIDEDASRAALRLHSLQENGWFSKYDIAVMDWPQYGRSEGRANAESLKTAALQALYHFSLSEKRENIYILAYSMGTGPAVYAASKWECSGLILVAPYDSAADLYNNVINIFHGPLKLLLSYKMDAGEYAKTVSISPLIIASRSDSRVPYESSLALSEKFPCSASFLTFDNLKHGDLMQAPEVLDGIETHLAKPKK